MKEKLSEIKGALLTGVSYMLPFVIAGGILIALGFAIGGYDIPNSVEEYGNFASTIFWLGKKAFALMVPVLGAYVAYSIADKPGIAVGMATNIPPHNLREVIDGVVKIIDNRVEEGRETSLEEILEIGKGPDFPPGPFFSGIHGDAVHAVAQHVQAPHKLSLPSSEEPVPHIGRQPS